MEGIMLFFKLLLYVLGSISLIAIIVLTVKLIYTVEKTNEILDDVNSKVKTLDGLFNAINTTSNAISSIGDRIIDKFFNLVGKIGRKNRKKEEEEFYE